MADQLLRGRAPLAGLRCSESGRVEVVILAVWIQRGLDIYFHDIQPFSLLRENTFHRNVGFRLVTGLTLINLY